MRLCETCGKELKKPRQRQFCSRSCAIKKATVVAAIEGAETRLQRSYSRLLDAVVSKNGTLLTAPAEFRGLRSKVKVQCNDCKHMWEPQAGSILYSGCWGCLCGGKCHTKNIDILRGEGQKRGFELVDTEYHGMTDKYNWRCPDGHQFLAAATNITSLGRGCPECHLYLSEEKCRFVLEQLLGRPFPKNRTALGDRLELDGYNCELNMAFEFHGIQHYVFKDHIYSNEQEFAYRVLQDAHKTQLCEQKHIQLLVIPYTVILNGDNALMIYVADLLGIPPKPVDWSSFRKFSSKLESVRAMLDKKHKLVTEHYAGNRSKVTIFCEVFQKEYTSEVGNIKAGHTCRWCGYERARQSAIKYDYDKAVKLYQDGMSSYQLQKMGYSKHGVLTELHKRGIPIREHKDYRKLDYQQIAHLRATGMNITAIAKQLGCSWAGVKEALRKA